MTSIVASDMEIAAGADGVRKVGHALEEQVPAVAGSLEGMTVASDLRRQKRNWLVGERGRRLSVWSALGGWLMPW